jgi:hypothetical protein
MDIAEYCYRVKACSLNYSQYQKNIALRRGERQLVLNAHSGKNNWEIIKIYLGALK